MGYVDIHSHVLYGLDDGARTPEQSLAMLALAHRTGTTDIVATPHANARFRFQPELVADRIAKLSGGVGPRIHRGCDFHLQADTIADALAHPAKYTINGQCYLLVEFPDLTLFGNTEAVLLRLLDAGLVPIVSHPERHRQLPGRLDDLERWVQAGCYVQVTAASYAGVFGRTAKTCANELLARGLVHFVASDAHDTEARPPDLSSAYARLSDEWGEDAIRPLFVDNPAAVLTGDRVDAEPPFRRRQRRRWYHFW